MQFSEFLKNRPRKARGTRQPPTTPRNLHQLINISILRPIIMATWSDLPRILSDLISVRYGRTCAKYIYNLMKRFGNLLCVLFIQALGVILCKRKMKNPKI